MGAKIAIKTPIVIANQEANQWKLNSFGRFMINHIMQGIKYEVDEKTRPPKNPKRPPKKGIQTATRHTNATYVLRPTRRSIVEGVNLSVFTKYDSIMSNTGIAKTW